MTGIGRLMPFTRITFLAGALALVGLPPFAGFFSKDSIVAAAMTVGWYGWPLWGAALAGSFLTGLYTFRLYYLVFPGEPSPFVREHHHRTNGREGPLTMVVPVAILAVLSTIGGWIQFAPIWTPITRWLEPAARTLAIAEPTSWEEGISSALTVALGLAGIAIAWGLYARRRLALPRAEFWQRLFERKFYFDDLYDALFYRPSAALAQWSRRGLEEPVLLAAGPELGEGTQELGRGARRLQTGLLRTYALALGAGIIVLAAVFLAVR
jgi:NADH-quinone oxidoreductase subunit L